MDGNQMKMREELLALSAWVKIVKDHPKDKTATECAEFVEQAVNAALSAPPRNCDKFADETDAQIAFLNEVWLISVTKETALERDKFENWTEEMRAEYAKWLFATDEKGASA